MAVTRVTNTRNGRAAIRYAFEEPSHKKGMDRVLLASGSNLNTNSAMEQMIATWKSHGKDNGKSVQMYRIIQSFGLDELNPDNPEHIAIANEIGQTLASELYPDKQALIVTQADGEGGKLHNHVLVNSVGFVDGKSLRGERTGWKAISDKSDEIIQRYGLKPIERETGAIKSTMAEIKLREKGEYVWKDDLRGRIGSTFENRDITSQDEFVEHMRDEYDVGVRFRGKKGVSYDFIDENGKKRTSRATALADGGVGFNQDAINELIQENLRLQQEQEQEKRSFKVDSIGFDFGAELEAMRKPKRSRSKPKNNAMSDAIRREQEQLRIERENERKRQEQAERERLEREEQERIERERQAEEQRKQEELERQEAEAKRLAELQAKKEREEREEQEREKERLREMLSKIMPKEKHHLLQDDSFLDTYKEEFLKTDTQAKPMERVVQAVLNAEKPPEQRRYDHEKKSVQVVEQVNDELQQQDEHELEL